MDPGDHTKAPEIPNGASPPLKPIEPVVFTPKYQVFISSTFKWMEQARKAAIAGVHDARHVPVPLDNFAPEDTADLEVIDRTVRECQIYILLLGPTYGKIPPGEEFSYTELEFRKAEKEHRWILVFTLAWEDIAEQRKRLDPQIEIESEELANTVRLKEFHDFVLRGKHFHRQWRWDNVEQIRLQVAIALTELPYRLDRPRGLVPEFGLRSEILSSVAENEFLQDNVTAIRGFTRLFDRTQKNVDAKVRAAEFLAECYCPRMQSEQTRGIFFESGSSVAFVAKRLPDDLWHTVHFGKDGEPTKRISTNNILVYLHLWLNKGVTCIGFPWGPPDRTYGASYGPIGRLHMREPDFRGTPIDPLANEAIASLGASRLALDRENTSIIITAASGLQLSKQHHIESPEDCEITPEVEGEVNRCFGPHVGSYHNMVLKRYLYQTRIPILLVLDSSKVDCKINVNKCHFIFGQDLPWTQVLRDHPLALCIGCKREELDGLMELLKSALPEFVLLSTTRIKKAAAVIARNRAFEEEFPHYS